MTAEGLSRWLRCRLEDQPDPALGDGTPPAAGAHRQLGRLHDVQPDPVSWKGNVTWRRT